MNTEWEYNIKSKDNHLKIYTSSQTDKPQNDKSIESYIAHKETRIIHISLT